MTKALTHYKSTEEYETLVGDLQAIVREAKFSAQMAVIEIKHEIGKAITESPAYKKHGRGNGKFLDDLAEDAGLSRRDLYYCLQFVEKYPNIAGALQSIDTDKKSISWTKVVADLPDPEDKRPCQHKDTFEVTLVQCRRCGLRIKKEKLET